MPPHSLLNFQRSFLAGIILAILVFSGVGIFTFMTISRHQDSAVWVEQSYEAISALQKIPADLRAMESGNRGFLLTQDPNDLSPYWQAHRSIQSDLIRARKLSHDIPNLAPFFNRLDPLVAEKLALIDHSVRLGRKGNFKEALDVMKNSRGKDLMEKVRSNAADMETLELEFLQSRKTQESISQGRELWTLFLSGIAVIFLLVAGGSLFLRQAREAHTTALRLLSSEKRFHSLFESTTDSFITTDDAGVIVEVNPATEGLFGFTRDELTGRSMEMILAVPGQDGDPVKPFARLLRVAETSRGAGAMEINMRRKDKAEFPAEVSLATWKAADENFHTIISRDISERKFFTKMLMKNEHRLFQFLEAIPVGIFVLDHQGKPYYANHAAKSLFPKRVDARVTPEQFAEAYGLFRAGQSKPYPSQEIPLVRALKGEKSSVEDLEIRDGERMTPLQAWVCPILTRWAR